MKLTGIVIALCLGCSPAVPSPEPSSDPSSEPSSDVVSADPVSEDPPVPESEDPVEPSSECVLYSFTLFAGEDEVEAVINQEEGTVSFEYGYDQRAALKAATAEAKVSPGAKVSPDITVSRDWLRPGTQIKVTAEDGTTSRKYSFTSSVLPAPRPKKPLIMWVDAANSYRYINTPEGVDNIVQKIYDGGFTGIALEVKPPVSGDVLYFKSDHLGYASTLEGGRVVNQSFDLLQAFIDACHSREMTLTVSYCIFTFAEPTSTKSRQYYEENLRDAFCKQLLTASPGEEGYIGNGTSKGVKIEDIRVHPADYWFLSPSHPAVHEYVTDMAREIVTNYDIDGFALDYCRYPNIRSDFSEYSRAAFEEYLGREVENWPTDFITVTSDDNMGTYTVRNQALFQDWMAWRAKVIQSYVIDIRDIVKNIKPSVALEAWAACWYQFRNEVGQNWGSYESNWASTHYSWANEAYDHAGYAEYLDIFHLGNYVTRIYGKSESDWSMEYFTYLAGKVVGDACSMYNSFGLYTGISADEATYYSYLNYDGVMIFELGTFESGQYYDSVKSGYCRAMRELGEL